MFGFGFSFGSSENLTNPYIGVGNYFFDPVTTDENSVGFFKAIKSEPSGRLDVCFIYLSNEFRHHNISNCFR